MGVTFIRVIAQNEVSFDYELSTTSNTVMLRSDQQLRQFWRTVDKRVVYLDVTGFDHKVWAPLLKSALGMGLTVLAVYVEPGEYRFSRGPREGDIFDLSERIAGIAPLPGFAYLGEADEANIQCIPLLGFE